MPITDSSGNVISGTASATFLANESDLLYKALIKPIRDLDRDEGGQFVKRFLERPQYWVDTTAAAISDLDSTDSPVTIRADLLQYLKDHVGLTKELDSITSRLSTADLRKLIALAVPLWKRKGTPEGLNTIARILTGRNPLYMDWFQFRNILGEAMIGEDQLGYDNWIIGGEVTEWDEYHSHLRIMDDGALDEQLLLDLLAIFRPISERIEVALVDFIDRFDLTRDRWSTYSGTAATLDLVEKQFSLPAACYERAIVPRLTGAALSDYVTNHKVNIGASANKHQVYWHAWNEGGGFYRDFFKLEICPSATDKVKLTRVTQAGGTVTLYSGTPASTPIVAGCWYSIRVQSEASYIHVYIDGNLVCSVQDDDGLAPQSGQFLIGADAANTAADLVDNVELWKTPLRFATLAPAGVTYTDNFIA